MIDLTAEEPSESADQSTMLVALIERFKGVAQALTTLSGIGNVPSQSDNSTVSDLYTWYGYLMRC